MSPPEFLTFGNFRLDFESECVWCGEEQLTVTLKAFAVLRYLAQRPNRVVTKEELFTAVWPNVVVSDGALSTCICELRRVLGDSATSPQIIETVHRRGFRFIAPVGSCMEKQKSQREEASPIFSSQHPAPLLVGRAAELAQLHNLLERAMDGERQVVFVTGEPGIGKTALVETFIQRLGTPARHQGDAQRREPGATDSTAVSANSASSTTAKAKHTCQC